MRVAIIQLTSTPDVDHSIRTCQKLAEQATKANVQWLLFPENAPFLGSDRDKRAVAQSLGGSMVQAFQEMAQKHSCWITIGSFPELSPDPKRTYNTQVFIDPEGTICAVYRKIHLFDVEVSAHEKYLESADVVPGSELVVAPMAFDDDTLVNVGLSICYDLRFPEMYRALVDKGADIITVPSAFTLQTGRDHWHPLLQARAIENQCYILAPNQWGHHYGNRHTYGHSVVYDPWGQMLACAPDKEGFIVAELDLDYLRNIRKKMPVRSHQQPWLLPPNIA